MYFGVFWRFFFGYTSIPLPPPPPWPTLSEGATCGYCGCLPIRHSKKDACYSSDSFGGTSAAGTSESAGPEKWKDEDLGWFRKLSVQARVAKVKNPHRRLILYQNPVRKHQNMGESGYDSRGPIMLVGRR